MPKTKLASLYLGLLLAAALLPELALANSVSVQTLRPTTNNTYTMVEDAFLSEAAKATPSLLLGAQYHFVNNPLIEYDETRTRIVSVLVDSIHTLDLMAAAYLRPDLEVAASLPLSLTHLGDHSDPATEIPSSDVGIGDLRIQGKYRLPIELQQMAFAVMPELYVPTGSRSLLLSNSSWGFGLMLAGEAEVSEWKFALNIGYRYQPQATFREIDYKNQLPLAGAVQYTITPKWAANVEILRALTLPSDSHNNPSEFYAGARYAWMPDLTLSGGLSFPTLFSEGSGDLRLLINAKYGLGI